MSEIQKVNGNSGSSKSLLSPEAEWNDDSYGELEDGFEIGDLEGDTYQKAHVTLDQIKDLERKGSSQRNLQGKDQDLLGILGEAEKNELSAEREEKFMGAAHQQKAEQLHEMADALYQKASLALTGGEDQNGTDGNVAQPLKDLSRATGQDPETVQELLKKHGLDLDHLPHPPDAKVAALLNDPDFSERLTTLKESVGGASQALKDEIAKQTKTAKDQNDQAQKSNQKRSSDDSAYRFLYDAHFHQDEKSQGLIEARKQLAAETASYLSALYGKEVKVEDTPEKAGMVSIGGATLNVLSNSSTGEIQFGAKIDWPNVEIVTFEVDNFGGSKTDIPPWMKEANYPMHIYHSYEQTQTNDWWYHLLNGVTMGLAMAVTTPLEIDKGVKASQSDHNIPSGGELKNIGVLSSGSVQSGTETDKTKTDTKTGADTE